MKLHIGEMLWINNGANSGRMRLEKRNEDESPGEIENGAFIDCRVPDRI